MVDFNTAVIGTVSLSRFFLLLLAILLTFVAAGVLSTLLIRILQGKVERGTAKLIAKTASYAVYAFGLYVAFQRIVQFDITATLAAIGIIGVVLWLPLIPLLQNFVAGVVLALERPFKEEDLVGFDGLICRVNRVGLRTTRLHALDGKVIIVPNVIFITSKHVTNYSAGEFLKVKVPLIVKEKDYSSVVRIIEKICYANPQILPNVPKKNRDAITTLLDIPNRFFAIPKNIQKLKPHVLITKVEKQTMALNIAFWIWDIKMKRVTISEFYETLLKELKKKKITLP